MNPLLADVIIRENYLNNLYIGIIKNRNKIKLIKIYYNNESIYALKNPRTP